MSHDFKSGRISQRFRTYWRPTRTRWTLQDDKNIITVQGQPRLALPLVFECLQNVAGMVNGLF
jgi:hypothetical protein